MNLIPKISLVSLSGKIFTWIARHRLAWPCALFLRIHIKKILHAPCNEKPVNVLIIPKEGFIDDILSSLGGMDAFNVYSVYRSALKAIAAGILAPSLDDNNYVSGDPAIEATKSAYRKFLAQVWSRLLPLIKFDAVLGGNFGYYAEHELAAALEELGTPFIALHKENLKSPGRAEFSSKLYRSRRGPFLGRKIFVYNNIERQLQVSSGVISPDRVVVTGMSRLDRIHRWRKAQSGYKNRRERPRVVFFSFWIKTGLPIVPRKAMSGVDKGYETLDDDLADLNWKGLARGCHQAVLRLARENPEIKVIIKSKGRHRESSSMYAMLGEKAEFPPNFEIVVGGDPFDLITASNVVCGFNSTSILETIAAGKPVVVPRFAETLDEKLKPYIVDFEDAVEYAVSPDDLIDRLRGHALNPKPINLELSQGDIGILERWVGNADGLAGERVFNALFHETKDKTFQI